MSPARSSKNKQCAQGEIGRSVNEAGRSPRCKSRQSFAKHAFFRRAENGVPVCGAAVVCARSDVLGDGISGHPAPERLAHPRSTVRKIVRHHRAEDAGHERWFLDDLAAMQIPAPDVRWLFGERHSPTRDAAYALVSEVYRTTDDRLRLVLVKTLESAGHVFFGRVAAIVERVGWSKVLSTSRSPTWRWRRTTRCSRRRLRGSCPGIRLQPKAAGGSEGVRRSLLRRLRHDVRCVVRARRPSDAGVSAAYRSVPPRAPRADARVGSPGRGPHPSPPDPGRSYLIRRPL